MLTLRLFLVFLIFSTNSTFAQCIDCLFLDEAMMQPEKVQTLNLRAKGLMDIPEEINEMINLRKLDISVNSLTTVDWKEFYLPELKTLIIEDNPGFDLMNVEGFSTAFPKLEILDVSGNKLLYISPLLATSKTLKELDISENDVRFIPDEIGMMNSLEVFNVSNNNILDAFWIRELWGIKEIYLAGNRDLKLEDACAALLEKDSLQLIQLSLDSTGGVPAGLRDVDFKHLMISNCVIRSTNSRICKNDSIQYITFDNCSFASPERVFRWVDNFDQIEELVFNEMEVSLEVRDLKEVNKIVFNSCQFESKLGLREINPHVDISAINCDIESGDFVGNAVKSRSIEVLKPDIDAAMLENRLPVIIEADEDVVELEAGTPSKVELALSSYEIPSNAFLRDDGSVYSGKVTLKIKEYDNPVENALAGVPMTYRGNNQNEIFASSGMIDFRAFDDNGNELQPNPEEVIQVEIKDLQPDQASDLFVFDEEQADWERIGRPSPSNYDSLRAYYLDSLNKLPDSNFVFFRQVPINVFLGFEKKRKGQGKLWFDYESIGRYNKSWFKRGDRVVYTEDNDQRWMCGNKKWIIDTTMTPQTIDFLKEIGTKRKKLVKYRARAKKNGASEALMPSAITDLLIQPNFEDDNYTMTFKYKGREVQLPVYADLPGGIKRVQQKEQKNQKEYQHLRRKQEKTERSIQEKYEEVIVKRAQKARERMADFMARPSNANLAQYGREVLRFGLTRFGLVNCDYFYANKPNDYLAYSGVAIDQNGDKVDVPRYIRYVVLRDNVCMSINSDNVPYFKSRRTKAFFASGENEVAVVVNTEKLKGKKVKPTVVRFSIEGMTGDQVAAKVLSL